MKRTKTLVIGWDAADWKFLNPLIDKGLMPNLKKLVDGGVSGKLSTLDPPLSPTLWTSIATGKRPYKHGIHGFSEPTPDGKGIRPINITSRKCKAIWNIFTQNDLRSHVVGWWPSHPAEPINGTMVSNLYQRSKNADVANWPMLDGTIHPKEKEEVYKKLRVHLMEITGNHVDPFVPRLKEVDQQKDHSPGMIRTYIADCASIHSAATYILEEEDWDFVGVYYDGIDHFCHEFMKYYPPRRPHIPQKEYELYKDVIDSACRFHDMMLARLVELAGEDCNIILLSDHGFYNDHNRPIVVPKDPMGPAIEHSPYGIIVMNGPTFKEDTLIHGASLLDITPTLLQLYGLPIGEDMDGKVLINAFKENQEVKTIKSWEEVDGFDGSHPEGFEINQEQSKEELQQLIDLGYIEDFGDDMEKAIATTIAENKFTLAKSYISGQEWEKGINLLEELYRDYPDKLHFVSRLIHSLQVTGRLKRARDVINGIKEVFPHRGAQIDLLEASLTFSENKPKKALELFQKVKNEAGTFSNVDLRIASAYYKMNEKDKALDAIKDHLKVDSESERAYFLKGRILLDQLQYEDALDAFLTSLGLDFHNPLGHYYVGECLLEMSKHEEAIKAYEKCLSFGQSYNAARLKIIKILVEILNQPGRAKRYQLDLESNIEGTINIVSGLPRSGTSMMMQMLEAGGLPIFTDHNRTADESNPKGYYEHEAVKRLAKNSSFLKNADGKTVKVIANLLKYLPSRYKYKVVFMNRDLHEILHSQQKMLIKDEKRSSLDTLNFALLQKYQSTLDEVKKWMRDQPNIEFLEVDFIDVMNEPFSQALEINKFFSKNLAVEKMAAVPVASLYRTKLENVK